MVDVGEGVGTFHALHLLVEGGAFLAVLGVGAVGVEPCGGGCLLGGELLALCLLLFGGWTCVGVLQLDEVGAVA